MSIKWNMNGKVFTAENEGYRVTIILGDALGCPYWEIVKDGAIIDTCYQHSPTKCDLTAKVQVERELNKILNKSIVT